jgi:acyl-CoA synthetase (AMP-forming)/AMP-acid ligase II
MFIDFLLEVFRDNQNTDAIVWRDQVFTYAWLFERVNAWLDTIKAKGIQPGSVTILEADFSPNSIALFLALIGHGCILVPLTKSVEVHKQEFIELAQGEWSIAVTEEEGIEVSKLPYQASHELYTELKNLRHPGLVLFSSGSTGKSKAAVHDFVGLLDKFKVRRKTLKTITFLLYDHIGGINTMLYVLANGGCMVTVADRTPDAVLQAIERFRVELLPTSPTFINLILLSEAYNNFKLDSLKLITYGTEPMPESTLRRFYKLFPHIRLQQTYGLSEVGILSSKSKRSDSLWMKIGGPGFETRVVDEILHIKAQSAMLGYLNHSSPFTQDGWFITGDSVEVDGEYLRILGRKSEIINVGGEKVYPQEVESVIQELGNVAEVTVYGEKNNIMGNIVCAKIRLVQEENWKDFTKRLKKYCREHLQGFKIPVKLTNIQQNQHSARFKKVRTI